MTKKLTKKLANLPHTPGVYIFRNDKGIPLYVGKSVNLKNRVRSYFQAKGSLPPKTALMIDSIRDVEIIQTESEIEALLLEASIIQALKPKYNSALKDDKRYKYIAVTQSSVKPSESKRARKVYHPVHAYPRFETSRHANNPHNMYFGPFPAGSTVNNVLRLLRKLFGWCAYKTLDDVQKQHKPCFYYHIKQCPGYCAGILSYEEYIEHIDTIIHFLQGKKGEVISSLQKKMQTASDNQHYEKAAVYKNQIEQLRYITQEFRSADSFFGTPILEEEQFYFARKQLQEILGSINPLWAGWLRNLERVEAYDISNLQGKQATGSMVVLQDGFPVPADYRRFKIQDMDEPDDFGMMKQVLKRRLKRMKGNQKSDEASFSQIPQLLVIDGGKGQVSAVLEALKESRITMPVIGLAKREEEVIIPVIGDELRFEVVSLPFESPSLQLLQRIRDEAHRFAKKYHVLLRDKKQKADFRH